MICLKPESFPGVCLCVHLSQNKQISMVLYSIEDITEGMIIGQSIYTKDKKLLIAAGFRLKRAHIDLLRKRGYTGIQINVEGTEDVIPESIISQHVQDELTATVEKSSKSIENVIHQSKITKEGASDIIKKNKKVLNQIIRNSGAFDVINKTIEDIMDEPWVVLNLSKMEQASSQLLEHAINVTVISLCIARKYHFTKREMKQLGLGVINYDLGMLVIPKEILNKDGHLTEDEKKILQQHAVYGYLMLSNVPAIPATASVVALSHHEHQDGSGYPRNIKGENRPPVKSFSKGGLIHRFAEIVAVADAYDMFINGRKHYSQRLKPKESIKKLIEMQGPILNSEIVKTLVSIVPDYPVGARIKIADAPLPDLVECVGVVSKVDPDHLSKPSIIIYESKHREHIKPIALDLAKCQGFTIELLS